MVDPLFFTLGAMTVLALVWATVVTFMVTTLWEDRRRRTLHRGDVVEFAGSYEVNPEHTDGR